MNLLNLSKKVWDQINPVDNGRTFKNPQGNTPAQIATGGVNPGYFQQLTHNAVTNTFGNLVTKPFIVNPIQSVDNSVKLAAGMVSGNDLAAQNAATKLKENIHSSVPGFVADNVIRGGQAGYNLGFKAPVQDLTGNTADAARTRDLGLNQFNKTVVGQMVSPVEEAIGNAAHVTNTDKAAVGLDPNATGAQKWIGNPVAGTLGTVGLMKGGAKIADRLSARFSPETAPVVEKPTITEKVIKEKAPVSEKVLGYKIKNVKDPVRRAELIAERDARFPKTDVSKIPINKRPLFGTPERVIKQMTKDDKGREILTENITKPQNTAVSETAVAVAGHLKNLRSIFEDAGILNGKSTNKGAGKTFFQFVEEGGHKSKAAMESLRQKVGDEQANRMAAGDKKLRPIFDDLYKRQNEVRASLGKDPIGYQENYLTHLSDSGFKGIDLADTAATTSNFSRATGKINPFSKERTGGKAAKNPVRAAEAYVRAAEGEINSLVPTAKINNLIDALEKRGDVPNNVINWMKEQRDSVSGQGHRVDRAIESTQTGKVAMTVLDKASAQAGRNLIGANPSSIFTQPAQLLNSGAKSGWINTLKALTAPLKGEALTRESELLRGRHAHLDELSPGLTKRLVDFSLKPIGGAQKAIDRIVYDAARHRAGQQGLTGKAALDWADAATQETLAARGPGQVPHAYKSKLGNSVLQFSLEMGNSLHQLAADELRLGRIGGITTYAIGAYGFNNAFNWITGKNQGVVLDPIQAALDVKKDVENGDYFAAAGRLPGELVANTPGGQVLAGGVKTINKDVGEKLFGQAGAGRYGVGVPAIEAIKAVTNVAKDPGGAAAYLAPTGGVPTKRLIEGVTAVAKGKVEDRNGNVIYEPKQTPQNYLRAGAFGKSTTGEGKQYSRDIQEKIISGKPTVTAKNATSGTVGANKELAKTEETKYKANVDSGTGEGYGLQQLSDGRYIYNIGGDTKTTTDKKKAQDDIAKDSFDKGDARTATIGDTYYYKGKDDKVHTQNKVLHEYDVKGADNQLALDRAYRASDLTTWLDVAGKQYDVLEAKKAYYDPVTESEEIVKITNQQEDLLNKAKGYQEKGINGSGGSGGKSAANALDMNQHRYTVSSKASGIKFSAAKGSSSGGATIGRKTIAKPKITLKKSKV